MFAAIVITVHIQLVDLFFNRLISLKLSKINQLIWKSTCWIS